MSQPQDEQQPQRGDRQPRPLLRTMLGDVLRRTRIDQGRTLADVARTARVSMPYLSEVERGRKEASSEVLAAICDALNIDIADLLAATGRDLITGTSRQARIVRLDAVRYTPAAIRPHGPGGAVCQLAA
ncbi:MAG: helix-turn-helix domain-containing protein [Streptosporangiaceae bacterium]